MSIEYTDETLTDAVAALASGAGRIQERLHDAALSLIRLRPDDFPDGDLRRTFVGVLDDLTYSEGEGSEGEGRLSATLRNTDDEDARAIAKRILRLHYALRNALGG